MPERDSIWVSQKKFKIHKAKIPSLTYFFYLIFSRNSFCIIWKLWNWFLLIPIFSSIAPMLCAKIMSHISYQRSDLSDIAGILKMCFGYDLYSEPCRMTQVNENPIIYEFSVIFQAICSLVTI